MAQGSQCQDRENNRQASRLNPAGGGTARWNSLCGDTTSMRNLNMTQPYNQGSIAACCCLDSVQCHQEPPTPKQFLADALPNRGLRDRSSG
jgi:hypothetical protein